MDAEPTAKHPEERVRPDLREAILRASLELGTELGEEGLTMRAIAARLGVSATALYQHFDGKAAILRAIRVYGGELMERTLAPAHEHEDPVMRLSDQSIRYVGFACDNPWLYRLLFQEEEIDWKRASTEELQGMMTSHRRTVQSFEDAVAFGRFRSDVDVATAPFLLWAANHGLATLILGGRISETHPAFPVRNQQEFVHAFVRSVLRGFEP
ncbi:MAG: TetR/AcrR family transcriptional regulator [Deltaproteobacteria bacterium]|nr:TetR/AcrR family transcriptional regulator [Nannocystaceae bacterium]